jgi:hypothetical protein
LRVCILARASLHKRDIHHFERLPVIGATPRTCCSFRITESGRARAALFSGSATRLRVEHLPPPDRFRGLICGKSTAAVLIG